MKRLYPSSLKTFLAANPSVIKADCFSAVLPTGTVMNVTEGQFDITVPSGTNGWTGATTTFHASTFGKWERGAITSEASFGLEANSMKLTCYPQQSTAYPNITLGILGAAFNGLFDACLVSAYTVYMPFGQYGVVTAGVETKFVGLIEKITNIDRTHVEFEVQDPFYLFNQKIPSRLIQTGCNWSFCDANCTLAAATYTTTFTLKTGSTQTTLTPVTAFTQPAGWATQGKVTCTAGNNVGLSQTVKLHDSSGNLEMIVPWILPVAAGDTYSVIAGCEKSATACSTRVTAAGGNVNNLVNFSGAIAVPVPSTGGL
jgi:uncharacterized phage protein (TIGR02218 family)